MKATYAYFPAPPNSPKHDSSRPCYPPLPSIPSPKVSPISLQGAAQISSAVSSSSSSFWVTSPWGLWVSFWQCRAGQWLGDIIVPRRDHTHSLSLLSPCRILVIHLCVSVSSLGVWRPPASPLPQELYWGLLRDRGKQVSMKARRGGRREMRWGMGRGPLHFSLPESHQSRPCRTASTAGQWLLNPPRIRRQQRVMVKCTGFRVQRWSFESPTGLSKFWFVTSGKVLNISEL